MSECYPFKSDHGLIPQENIWNDSESIEKTSIPQFSITPHGLSENECFGSVGTEYLAELEAPNDIAFSDLHNLTLEQKIDLSENVHFDNVEDSNAGADLSNQVIVFKVDGSDDLYGMQMVQDEHGNIEKYQFKFGTNDNGELEAIPDTIQLIPNEDTDKPEETGEFLVQEGGQAVIQVPGAPDLKVLVQEATAGEDILDTDAALQSHSEVQVENPLDQTDDQFEECIDNEQEINNSLVTNIHNIKQELLNEDSQDNIEELSEVVSQQNCKLENYEEYQADEITNHIENIYQDEVSTEAEPQENSEVTQYEEYEEVYIQGPEMRLEQEQAEVENHIVSGLHSELSEVHQSDSIIINGMHISADTNSFQHPETQSILQTALEDPPNSNILKQYAAKINSENNVDSKVLYYIVQQVPQEKENVNNSIIYKPYKTNPRSILKTSYSVPVVEEPQYDAKFDKRFLKSREAVQARVLHNYITKTTIPQAPVRQQRLPRKQKIKPVNERVDEEIIVEEVMVSSNGVIEAVDPLKTRRNNIHVTEYVELTDSEDEGHKYKTGAESDASVIEIHSDEDVEESPKKRGRPRKPEVGKPTPSNGAVKKKRNRLVETQEVKCPRCPKTFPNQNCLNTHIQHHNLESSMLSQQSKSKTVIEYKHKCKDCESTFKNAILLNKHKCSTSASSKPVKKMECTVCKKKFTDITLFNNHKRSHIKENVLKSTSSIRVSPAKYPPDRSKIERSKKSPAFKCGDCAKAFATSELLRSHSQIHKKLSCLSCTKTFSSKILLDTHVRENCVKYKSPQGNRRLSFKITSSIGSNKRRSSLIRPRKPTSRKTDIGLKSALNTPSTSKVQMGCELCPSTFSTHKDLFKHKVVKHGLETPDKTVTAKTRKSLYKPLNTHGGIPANERLRKAYAELKQKLDCSEDV